MAKRNKRKKSAKTSVLYRPSVLPESKDVRFIDALVGLGIGAVSGVWTASRPTATQRFGWAVGSILIGGLALVEGRGSVLRYGGAAVMAANGAVVGLEVAGLTKQGL